MKLLHGNWHLNARIWRFKCRRLAFMKLTLGLLFSFRIDVNQSCFRLGGRAIVK